MITDEQFLATSYVVWYFCMLMFIHHISTSWCYNCYKNLTCWCYCCMGIVMVSCMVHLSLSICLKGKCLQNNDVYSQLLCSWLLYHVGSSSYGSSVVHTSLALLSNCLCIFRTKLSHWASCHFRQYQYSAMVLLEMIVDFMVSSS